MNIEVLTAIIGATAVILSALLGYFSAVKKHEVEDAKREQEQKDLFKEIFKQMANIEKRLDEHNHYAEKYVETAKTLVAIQKDIVFLKEMKEL